MIGFGLGLYPIHYRDILDTLPKSVDWFEIISENYMVKGGTPLFYLEKIRSHYPIAMHGVSLSIGSAEPVDKTYLKNLRRLIARVEPMWVSDHISFSKIEDMYSHDLLPLPYTEECVDFLSERISQVQDYLGQRILLENISSYVSYDQSNMPEYEFIRAVVEKSDCYLLLDVNNIYVNAFNHQFSAEEYLSHIPFSRVKEFHMAGHKKTESVIIDTHGSKITQDVYNLYAQALHYAPHTPTLIERDNHTPPLAELLTEIAQMRKIYHENLHRNA